MYNDQNEQKMSMVQIAELQHVMDIIRSAKSVRRKTIKGVQYHIALYTDTSGKDMHLIFGGGGWFFAPADRPLKECLVGGLYMMFYVFICGIAIVVSVA